MNCDRSLRRNPHYNLPAVGIEPETPGRFSNLRIKGNRDRMASSYREWRAHFWHTLFRPTQALQDLASQVLDEAQKYDVTIGLHIREGGKFGGASDADTTLRLKGIEIDKGTIMETQLHWFLECATAISRSLTNQSVVWVVASDHVQRASWISKHTGYTVLSLPKTRSVHTDRSTHSALEWRQTVADWYILSQSTHMLISPSSFSITAAMWTNKMPMIAGEECPISFL